MGQTLEACPIESAHREQTQHPALFFQFAAQGRMIGPLGNIGRKNIHGNQRYDQHAKDAEDDFQEDFRSQGAALAPSYRLARPSLKCDENPSRPSR